MARKRGTTTSRAAARRRTGTRASGSTTRAGSSLASGQGTRGSVWPQGAPQPRAAAWPALEVLAADVGTATTHGDLGLTAALLELVGTEHLTLGLALAAWQREQDRVANRSWRRPGGLVRLAGL